MQKKFSLISLGCPKNLVDSEVFCAVAMQHGYVQADETEGVEFCLINTCSFIQDAVKELARVLKTVFRYKSKGMIKRIFVTGCIMKRYLREIQEQFPEVDAWIPIRSFGAFEALLSGSKVSRFERELLTDGPYAYLKVSDGCNNRCSYCTIPSIRGNLCSLDIGKLVKEAQELVALGSSELIVIAQDTSAYGTDSVNKKLLPELLQRLHDIEGLYWIRLMYLHPRHVDALLINTIASLPKIVHAFEMPLQHCNDAILKRMNRHYGKADIIRIIELFKENMPDVEFRTTFMTGFPGEGRREFNELLGFVADYRFLRLGAFAFSPEPGTSAFEMTDRVSSTTAIKRRNELLTLHRELSEQYLAEFVGREIEVIVEESYPEANTCTGRAWFDAPEIDGVVSFLGVDCGFGDIVRVKVEDVIDIDLYGRLSKVVHKFE